MRTFEILMGVNDILFVIYHLDIYLEIYNNHIWK